MGGLFLSSSPAKQESYQCMPSPVRCRAGCMDGPSPRANQGEKKADLQPERGTALAGGSQLFPSQGRQPAITCCTFLNKTPVITQQHRCPKRCSAAGGGNLSHIPPAAGSALAAPGVSPGHRAPPDTRGCSRRERWRLRGALGKVSRNCSLGLTQARKLQGESRPSQDDKVPVHKCTR